MEAEAAQLETEMHVVNATSQPYAVLSHAKEVDFQWALLNTDIR